MTRRASRGGAAVQHALSPVCLPWSIQIRFGAPAAEQLSLLVATKADRPTVASLITKEC